MSKSEKMRAGSYEGATHICFARDVGKNIKRGEIYRISKVDHERAELMLTSGGKTESYRPARHGSGDSFTQVFTQSQITLHEGDQIKFRQKDRKLGVGNNDFGRIKSISNGEVTIQRDNTKTVTLEKGHRMLGHIDHAWANTAYSFQGATVQDNIAIMRSDNNPLNTLASLYVGSSRHQDNLAIVTDDKDRLLQIISEKLELESEPITFIEPTKREHAELSEDHDQKLHIDPPENSEEFEQEMEMGGFSM